MPHRDPETARKYRLEKYRALKERDPEYGKRQYWKHREKRLAECRAKRQADVEKACAYQRAMYAKHREKRVEGARRYRRKNSEAIAARAMAKYYRNRDVINERRKGYRAKNYDKIYARCRAWLKRNPDRADIQNAKRIINEQTGVPIRDIPNELAELKIDQLKVSRLARQLRAG